MKILFVQAGVNPKPFLDARYQQYPSNSVRIYENVSEIDMITIVECGTEYNRVNSKDIKIVHVLPNDRGTLARIDALDRQLFDTSVFDEERPQGEVFAIIDASSDTHLGYAVFGQVWLPTSTEGYITRIGLYPEYQNQGIGTFVLNEITLRLQNVGCPCAIAGVDKANTVSKKMLEKCGYMPDPELYPNLTDFYWFIKWLV